jgi:hypothetical protein
MTMTSAQVAPALVVSFVAWRVYVRVRRNIGRQPWQPKRLVGRAILFGVISGLYALGILAMNPSMLTALLAGMALGALLALWGLHLTEFTATPEGKYYTPNLWIGLTLTLLFVGRLAYRMIGFYAGSIFRDATAPAFFQSPLTIALFGLTAGYYVAYNIDIVRRGRKILG